MSACKCKYIANISIATGTKEEMIFEKRGNGIHTNCNKDFSVV